MVVMVVGNKFDYAVGPRSVLIFDALDAHIEAFVLQAKASITDEMLSVINPGV